jgi:SAM-dependent methyltransferase
MSIRERIVRTMYRSKWMQALFFNPLCEYHQWRLNRFVRRAASETRSDQSIIDIGAGELKYKRYFAHCKYFSNDLCVGDSDWNYTGIDIVSSAYELPVEHDKFDSILCIQVLEHLDYPDLAFGEFQRILKSGGRAYVSCPLIAGEHQQPHDYFRYTKFGLTALAERHGFRVISIEPHGGSAMVVETMSWASFWDWLPLPRQTGSRYVLYFLLYPIKFLTGCLALLFDKLDRKKSMTINYDMICEKL